MAAHSDSTLPADYIERDGVLYVPYKSDKNLKDEVKEQAAKEKKRKDARRSLEIFTQVSNIISGIFEDDQSLSDQYFLFGLSRDLSRVIALGRGVTTACFSGMIKDAQLDDPSKLIELTEKFEKLMANSKEVTDRLRRISMSLPAECVVSTKPAC